MKRFQPDDFRRKSILSNDGEPIPVGSVWCVGRNYARHIEELNSQDLGAPVIFSKPVTSIEQQPVSVALPSYSQEVHHEVELAIVIGRKGRYIPESVVGEYIAGVGVALDLTCRDIQAKAKQDGTPWTIAKGFDGSAPISRIHDIRDLTVLSNAEVYLEKNGQRVQQGNTRMMLYPIPYLISYLSDHFTLNAGDIILTGTPEGVGPVQSGDTLTFWADFCDPTTLTIM